MRKPEIPRTVKSLIWTNVLTLSLWAGISLSIWPPASSAQSGGVSLGPVTPKDTIYQIVTDRFFDGDLTNNFPVGFDPSLFDDPDGDGRGNGQDLKLYQGGDFKGITDQIQYLKNLGITAVWISPPYRNRDTVIEDHQPDGWIDRWTSYHGFHARNFFATNKHFGKMAEFEALRDILHANGIRLIVGFAPNHTSRWQNPTLNFQAEDGRLFEPDKDAAGNYIFDVNGDAVGENLLADPHNDVNGWFHGLGDRGSDTSKFGFRHKELGSLADFSHENSQVVEHLEKAALFWKSRGIDGLRIDATLHINPAFGRGLKDAIDSETNGPLTQFGEFFIGRPDPKYDEFRTFPDRTGIHNLDFEYFRAQTNVFGSFSETMTDFANMLLQTEIDYTHENQAYTFLDNHDVTRFRFIQPNNKPYHAAIATLMTSRGTPIIYYGTEQYLTSATNDSNDGRVFMQVASNFDQTTTAYELIQKLTDLRRINEGIAFGLTEILYSTNDVLVFSRKFFDKQVVVAVNRQPDQSFSVPALTTSLPVGTYPDFLSGLLFGSSIAVSNIGGQNQLTAFTLSGGEVNVWSYNPDLGTTTPRLGNIVPTMGRAGNRVFLYGTGLGGSVTVRFAGVPATVLAGTNESIEVIAPAASAGLINVAAEKNGQVSNPVLFDLLLDDQVQVIFHVRADTIFGENIHVVGSIPELGAWNPARSSESFMNPNHPDWFLPVSVPKGAGFQFKFIKKDGSGNVIWEGGLNRSFTAPSGSTDTLDTPLFFWQN